MRFDLIVLSLLLPLSLSVRIVGDLLSQAEREGFIDTFVHFTPFDFGSRKMARVRELLKSKVPGLTAYAGLQEFTGEQEGQLTPEQLRRGVRRQTIMELLKRHSQTTQEPTIKELRQSGYEVKSFWIDNSILIKRAPLYLLTTLVQMADLGEGKDIISLSPNRIVARIPPVQKMIHLNGGNGKKSEGEKEEGSDMDLPPWNIRLIKADKVWERTRGANVVLANIDTGVDFLHPLLKPKYRGLGLDKKSLLHEYNWYDPMGLSPLPHDVHGHGTHTMGTMVGENIGIAPETKWIAAQGCDKEGCSQERLLSSAQWVMCPLDANGGNPRCELGADIVNNSWGGEITDDESLTWFSASVEAWLAAGMIPIFAQGNSGPGCATAGTPGDLENVIGIGAVDEFAALTIFSSRGPGGARLGHAKFKPDFVAPGQAILSCKPGGTLVAMSGTSMAAPHMAGVAALLLSLKGDLTFKQLRTLIKETINTADLREPQMGQQSCFGMRWDQFPNYHYGFGLIDAEAAAVRLLPQMYI